MIIDELSVVRFGVFELCLATGELKKNGRKVALRPQAVRALAALAARSGQLVSREELRDLLWSTGTYVDFEHGLNLCIQEVRAALHDDANSPRFIETLPRRGYRFIGPVETVAHTTPQSIAPVVPPSPDGLTTSAAVVSPDVMAKSGPANRKWMAMLLVVLAAAVAAQIMFVRKPAAGESPGVVARSVAVLPLKAASTEQEQVDLAKGLTVELVRQLWRVDSLRVLSDRTAFELARSKKPLRTMARQLNVTNVLSGSAERHGDRVRMQLTLGDAQTGKTLWTKNYDSDLNGLLSDEADAAHDIARALDLRLTSAEPLPPAGVRAAAHEFFLRSVGEKDMVKSRAFAEKAVAIDPNFSIAWSRLAILNVNGQWFSQNESPAVGYEKARQCALRALAIDDTNSVAHNALAAVKLHHDWDWAGAEREFRRALEVAASNAAAHHIYAHYLLTMDRLRESVAESRKATELDPLNPAMSTCVGWHCLYARQYDDAVAQCLALVNDERATAETYYYLGRVYARQGKLDEAIAALEVSVERSGGLNSILATLGHVYARAGRRQDAERVLSILQQHMQKGYVSALDVAVVYAGMGDADKTFEWLEKAYQERSTWIIHIKWDERFASVRSDPRFESLVRRIGLPRPESVREHERPALARQVILPAR